ncbi:AGAP013472-PA-like protein [Anopheles sinensis]|uniref:AGAP013472-PA-like protein n=1 Tax=Anopheles sinensis TaxID=74873 RepID=A0A084VCJ0_ANOSI|nr:AGAP013472-PA-like protein [Anopheles sinensis]
MAADEPAPSKPDMKPPKDSKKQMDEKGSGSAKETKASKASQDAELPARSFLIPRTRSLPGCPLCDASVYSYCDEKVYHDACCCGSINGAAPPYGGGFGGFGGPGGGFGGPGGGFGGFGGPGGGGGCGYQGCSYLYANTCYEHQLIVNCCCNSPY